MNICEIAKINGSANINGTANIKGRKGVTEENGQELEGRSEERRGRRWN
jgi:hypothetical protein